MEVKLFTEVNNYNCNEHSSYNKQKLNSLQLFNVSWYLFKLMKSQNYNHFEGFIVQGNYTHYRKLNIDY
jgi:hypothetical protein